MGNEEATGEEVGEATPPSNPDVGTNVRMFV
jgi:hypothetical protein